MEETVPVNVTLVVREQKPLFGADFSAFLSCADFVRCPTGH